MREQVSCSTGVTSPASEVLPKRFARFGLRLYPQKTRLVGFERAQLQPMGGA
jgi:hypothetical protein